MYEKPQINSTQITEHLLKALRFNMGHELGQYAMESMDVIAYLNQISDSFSMKIKVDILGQDNIQKYSFDYKVTRNWFQHLKRDKFPKWYLKRFPVKYDLKKKSIEFNHMALAPKFNLSPQHGKFIVYTEPIISGDIYRDRD